MHRAALVGDPRRFAFGQLAGAGGAFIEDGKRLCYIGLREEFFWKLEDPPRGFFVDFDIGQK